MNWWIGIIIVLVIIYAYYAQKKAAKPPPKLVPYVDPSLKTQTPAEEAPLVDPINDQELKELGGVGGSVTTTAQGLNGSVPLTFRYEGLEPTCEEYKKALIANELNPDPGSEFALKCPDIGQVTARKFYRYGDAGNTRDCLYLGSLTCAKLIECSKQSGVSSIMTYMCASTPSKVIA